MKKTLSLSLSSSPFQHFICQNIFKEKISVKVEKTLKIRTNCFIRPSCSDLLPFSQKAPPVLPFPVASNPLDRCRHLPSHWSGHSPNHPPFSLFGYHQFNPPFSLFRYHQFNPPVSLFGYHQCSL